VKVKLAGLSQQKLLRGKKDISDQGKALSADKKGAVTLP
jgi:hypothetical protein